MLPLDEENLSHTVRFVLGGQFRKGEMVSGKRVNAVEDDTSCSTVIPMPAREIVIRAVRVQRHDQGGAPPPNLVGDVTPQGARVLQFTVLVAEKLDVPDAEHAGRAPLFLFSDRRERPRRDAAVGGTLVAVGHDDVGDVAAFLGQAAHGAAGQAAQGRYPGGRDDRAGFAAAGVGMVIGLVLLG